MEDYFYDFFLKNYIFFSLHPFTITVWVGVSHVHAIHRGKNSGHGLALIPTGRTSGKPLFINAKKQLGREWVSGRERIQEALRGALK